MGGSGLGTTSGAGRCWLACLGDVMLDVIVETAATAGRPTTTRPPAITFAAGGQAANVATWVAALGGRARVFGPPSPTRARSPRREALMRAAASRCAAPHDRRAPAPWSPLVSRRHPLDGLRPRRPDLARRGSRSGDLARRRGLAVRLRLRAAAHARPAAGAVETAAVARAHGTRIAVDLASASMIAGFGADRLLRAVPVAASRRWSSPTTPSGRTSTGPGSAPASNAVLVLKHGAAGASFVDRRASPRTARPVAGPVVDVDRRRRRAGGRLPGRRRRPGDGGGRRAAWRTAAPSPDGAAMTGPLTFRGVVIPAGRAALAVQPVQRPGRAVGEHRRLPGRAELRRAAGRRPARHLRERLLARLGTGSSTAC